MEIKFQTIDKQIEYYIQNVDNKGVRKPRNRKPSVSIDTEGFFVLVN